MPRVHGDGGGIVVGWLTKVVVAMSIVAIFAFDGIAIGSADMTASDDANSAASAAAINYSQTHNVQDAYAAAINAVDNTEERIPAQRFVVNTDGSVQLVMNRDVRTLVFRHIGPLEHYTHLTLTGHAPAPQ